MKAVYQFELHFDDDAEVINEREEQMYEKLMETAENSIEFFIHTGSSCSCGNINRNQFYISNTSEYDQYITDISVFIFTEEKDFIEKMSEWKNRGNDEFIDEVVKKVIAV